MFPTQPDDAAPYVLEARLPILREVDWLTFHRASRDGARCLLVQMRGEQCPEAFDADVAAMATLRHPAWLTPGAHGRLGRVPYLELTLPEGVTLATLLTSPSAQVGIDAPAALVITRALVVVLDELAQAPAHGAVAPRVVSDTLFVSPSGGLRLVPPFPEVMDAYGPSATGFVESDSVWSSDGISRAPDRIMDVARLLTMLVCGVRDAAQAVAPPLPDRALVLGLVGSRAAPDPARVRRIVERCFPDARDRFAGLGELAGALEDTGEGGR